MNNLDFCPHCIEQFSEKDILAGNIVYCPDCGAPFHRSCYEECGCMFADKHSANFSYDSSAPSDTKIKISSITNNTAKSIVKSPELSDKEKNEQLDLLKLNMAETFKNIDTFAEFYESRAYSDNENMYTDVMGNFSVGKFVESDPAATKIPLFYDVSFESLLSFKGCLHKREIMDYFRMSRTGFKNSFNIFAGILSPFWFFYRRMRLAGIIMTIIGFIFSIPSIFPLLYTQFGTGDKSNEQYTSIINFMDKYLFVFHGINIVFTLLVILFADFIYLKFAVRKISKIKQRFYSRYNADFFSNPKELNFSKNLPDKYFKGMQDALPVFEKELRNAPKPGFFPMLIDSAIAYAFVTAIFLIIMHFAFPGLF